MDISALKEWFLRQRRSLPWRDNPDPYGVWVSEVMLQQTQVAVVIPYFLRWMDRFPNIFVLAKASADEVIKMWEGLGYYSRARNLHLGAQYVVERFNGIIPSTADELSQIKGLGPYTVGAIRAFAFKQKAAAVDGNVLRVLSRFYNLHDPIDQPKVVARLRLLADALMPEMEPWIVAEALIELGATICSRRPVCELCPLKKGCKGYASGTQELLPKKNKRMVAEKLFRAVAVVKSSEGLLLRRCQEGEIMNDLHEFPYFDVAENGSGPSIIHEKLSLPLSWEYTLAPVSHSFTRFRVHLDPMVFWCEHPLEVGGYRWVAWDEVSSLAFSSGHRRILQAVFKEEG